MGFNVIPDPEVSGLVGAPGPPGLAGANGNKIFVFANSTEVGQASGVVDGDFAVRTDTGNVYQRAGGAWVLEGNIIGPAGPEGPEGPAPTNYLKANDAAYQAGVRAIFQGDGTNNIMEWRNPTGGLSARIGANGNIVGQGVAYFAGGVQVGSTSTDFGGGAGAIVGIDDATTVPTTNPTAGVILYSEGGALKYRKPDGTVVTVGSGGGAGTVTSVNTKLPDVNGAVSLVAADVPGVLTSNSSPTFNDFMVINATTDTTYGIVALRKLNKKRWMFAVSGASETGSDNGSNFMIQSYSDAEADKTVHFFGDRASGNTIIGGSTVMNGARLAIAGGALGIADQASDPTSSSLGAHFYSKSGRPWVKRSSGATGGTTQWEVQPRPDEWLPEDLGLKAWSSDPAVCQSAGAYTGTTGIRITAVNLRQPQSISKIVWHFLGYAGGLQTGSWAAIYNTSGTRVATSGDLSTATYEPAEQHASGGGASFAPLTATWSAPAGIYYIAWRFIYNTTTGDGPMCLAYENSAGAPPNVFGLTPVKRFGVISGTALTASPASITTTTIKNGANRFWAALA
ncbi:minor tail protein [Streptomyces phage phiScoe10]|nr:minor tail protein [Streptomyces phage phiScoe10]